MNARTRPVLIALLSGVVVLCGCSVQTPPTSAPATLPPIGDSVAPGGAASGPSTSGPAAVPPGSGDALQDPAAVLDIPDQNSEGPTVNVQQAAVTSGGFVVVSADGGRNVLGYGVVPAGTEPQPLQVSLAEEPTEQLQLTARLYADTSGDGLFGAGDKPVTNGKATASGEKFGGVQVQFSFQGKPVVNG